MTFGVVDSLFSPHHSLVPYRTFVVIRIEQDRPPID